MLLGAWITAPEKAKKAVSGGGAEENEIEPSEMAASAEIFAPAGFSGCFSPKLLVLVHANCNREYTFAHCRQA